jgi:hypothetical protein
LVVVVVVEEKREKARLKVAEGSLFECGECGTGKLGTGVGKVWADLYEHAQL